MKQAINTSYEFNYFVANSNDIYSCMINDATRLIAEELVFNLTCTEQAVAQPVNTLLGASSSN